MSVSLAPERIVCLTTVTTAANVGTGRPIYLFGRELVTFYVIGAGTISGGTILFEEADFDPNGPVYAGTWSNISSATVTASDVSGGKQQAVHISATSFMFIRPRVSADITGGGTISVVAKVQ